MSLGTVQRNNPLITSVDVGATQTSHTFREHTRGFQVHCNGYYDIRWAWETGETADSGDYMLLRVGSYWWEDDIYNAGGTMTLYLRAPDIPSGTVEVAIQEWL